MNSFWSDAMLEDFQSIGQELLETWKGKTIAVSGATGFVGSLLSRLFIWANETYGLDTKLVLVARNEQKLRDMYELIRSNNNIAYVIRDFSGPSESLAEPFDLLVHTAAITTSKVMIENPVGVLDICYNGTKWAMESARKNEGSKVIYLSSMETNGSFNEPVVADENTLGYVDLTSVRSSYPEGKRVTELLCKCYAEQYGVNVTTGRLAQTFGAGLLPSEGRVFKQFAISAIKGEDIVLHTDGLSEGNYVYSIDALGAILLLAQKGKAGETYNIANEECHTTIRDMAKLVADNFSDGKSKLIIEAQDSSKFGYAAPTQMTLSSSKLRKLGWQPKNDLVNCYGRTIVYLKQAEMGA